jgi:Spy/CpxP family protein refolding chaperone
VLRVHPPEEQLAAVAPLLCAGITTYSPLRYWNAEPGKKIGGTGLGTRADFPLEKQIVTKFVGCEILFNDQVSRINASDRALPPDSSQSINSLKEILMKRFTVPRTFAAILILSLGLAAGSSFAVPWHGDRHGMRADTAQTYALGSMFHWRALTRLHNELNLDAQQENLWKKARDFAREQRGAVRDRLERGRAEIKTLLEQPGSDLRAVTQRMDALRAEGLAQRDAVRDRWFAVYDSLGAEQKEKVRLFFKDGAERTERPADRAGERHGRERPRHGRRTAQD